MSLITYHINKSTGVGGVENLIRTLQTINKGKRVIEYYHGTCGNEVSEEMKDVEYVDLGNSIFPYNNKINNNLRKTKFYKMMNRVDVTGNNIIIFNPFDLLFFPEKTLKNNRVIIVQANRVESIFCTLRAKLALKFRSPYINLISVYTSLDKAKLLEYYPNFESKIEIIPRGCKIEPSLALSERNYNLVTIARVQEGQKNFNDMFKVLSMLPDKYTLDIWGDGDERELNELKVKISEHDRVNFKGYASDIKKTLEDYSLFIMTSHYEGFGQTLIEARSQGLPIVAFNTFEALEWVVEDKVSGRIIEPYNIESFKDSILEICEDYDTYNKYSKGALEKSKDTKQSRINKIWDRILNEG